MKEEETLNMFSNEICKNPGCHIYALKGSHYCFLHTKDKDKVKQEVIEDLKSDRKTHDLSIVGAEFKNLSIENKIISGSNFAFSVFDRCIFKNVTIVACFFDFALFRDTEFIDSEIRYSVFAGSMFFNSRIEGCTAIHNNFIGLDSYDSDFSHNDFYHSSFSVSKMLYSKMEDCNLKKADFSNCLLKEVSFRYSNLDEAYRREEDYFI